MIHKQIEKLATLHEAHIDRQEMSILKHNLLAEIGRRQDERDAPSLAFGDHVRLFMMRATRKFIPTHQKAVAALIIVLMMVSTTFIAQAAVPGDVLWPVKITLEKAEVALAVDSASESRVHLRHVDNRLKELSIIVAQVQPRIEKNSNVSKLVRRLEKDITAANQSLKISKAEKKDTQPQLIMDLAKDLNNKASQAVEILEVNKLALAAEDKIIDAESTTPNVSTTTDDLSNERFSETTTALLIDNPSSGTESVISDIGKVIAEVQQINTDVSYSALESMIELVEKERTKNRSEVTAILNFKIQLLKNELMKPKDIVDRINNDFILHRTEIRSLIDKSETLTTDASDLLVLDNLSGSYKKAVLARQTIQQTQAFMDEVIEGGGVIPLPEPVKPEASQEITPVILDSEVTMQAIGDTASTSENSMLPDHVKLPAISE